MNKWSHQFCRNISHSVLLRYIYDKKINMISFHLIYPSADVLYITQVGKKGIYELLFLSLPYRESADEWEYCRASVFFVWKSVKFAWHITLPHSTFSTNEGCGEKLLFCRITCPRWATGIRVIEFKIIFSYNHLEIADLVSFPPSQNTFLQTCCSVNFIDLDHPILKDFD